jgi:hypothetical protein
MCTCGRPTKLNHEVLEKLREAASWDCTIAEMALHAGIHEATFYNWCEKYPTFLDEINRLRENPVLTARQTVVKSLASDKPMALAYLSRKRRGEFGEGVKVDLSGAILASSDPNVIAQENAIRQHAEEALRGLLLKAPPKNP